MTNPIYRVVERGPSGRINRVEGTYHSLYEALAALPPGREIDLQGGDVVDQLDIQIAQARQRANRLWSELGTVFDELDRKEKAKRALVGWSLNDFLNYNGSWQLEFRSICMVLDSEGPLDRETVVDYVAEALSKTPEEIKYAIGRSFRRKEGVFIEEDGVLSLTDFGQDGTRKLFPEGYRKGGV